MQATSSLVYWTDLVTGWALNEEFVIETRNIAGTNIILLGILTATLSTLSCHLQKCLCPVAVSVWWLSHQSIQCYTPLMSYIPAGHTLSCTSPLASSSPLPLSFTICSSVIYRPFTAKGHVTYPPLHYFNTWHFVNTRNEKSKKKKERVELPSLMSVALEYKIWWQS